MPHKTNTTSQPCLFCNSLSHTTGWCNSNMKGRRNTLEKMKDCMMADQMPDFNSFPVNELRFVVSEVVLNHPAIVFPRRQFTTDEIKILRSQIPITLPKTRMVRELVKRWKFYGRIRAVKNTTPEDGDDCPICMDCMETPIWNPRLLRWDMIDAKISPRDAMFPSNIRTQCGHIFCGSCWESHYTTNTKVDYATDMTYLSCPMCRHKLRC
jgi:hypothetical protein